MGVGDNTLITGFVVSGTAPKRVLVRAAGPALAQFGVPGTIARPRIALMGGAGIVAQNAGWSASADAAAIATAASAVGAFPFANGSADAAVIISLQPGAYTVNISDAGGASGVALVELYELP